MDGYTRVARFMGNHNEMAAFRGFQVLGFQNLLYQQAELIELETELRALALADKSSHHPSRPLYEKHWRLLSRSAGDGNDEQWQKVLQIRAKLREYCESPKLNFVVNASCPHRNSIMQSLLLIVCPNGICQTRPWYT
jgi:hypothetical protein